MTHPTFLGLIPARKGSKGIPNKNLKILDDKPLVQYTIETALGSGRLDCIALSTDGKKIMDFASQFQGIETPFLRPPELATDSSPAIDVIRHAIDYYEAAGRSFDYVVLLQPTSPFRMPDVIDSAIGQIVRVQADSLVSLGKMPDRFNPYWAYEHSSGWFERVMQPTNMIARRQDLPDTYYRDGEIYITRTSLIRKGQITGGKVTALINENQFAINLDTMEDWVQAEQIVKQWKKITNPMYWS
ncbi:acylneuraminate cytidylyltransferase family protein [Dyadobacter sp. MSC1_007]|jgi:CMP-N,N'-diacetyllegionaminic acid synthase|uniref:acylneuraminate cytidylyltransferase family protein n=1 Tax=Dyadobacter sp. MSC1_007 TaxID=2909264 RepID=UPI00202F9045|nr:acylneuraminate cytidylyltransferase family protein [Dyadobacter sp. MSC1_007]